MHLRSLSGILLAPESHVGNLHLKPPVARGFRHRVENTFMHIAVREKIISVVILTKTKAAWQKPPVEKARMAGASEAVSPKRVRLRGRQNHVAYERI